MRWPDSDNSTYRVVFTYIALSFIVACATRDQNKDPLSTEIITTDLANFWEAMDKSGEDVDPTILQNFYLDKGTEGLKSFMKGRIISAQHLALVIKKHKKYYESIRQSVDSINYMKGEIIKCLTNFKEVYPEAIFPPVYFVIGAMNTGGTSSRYGLVIGAEMHGLCPNTPMDELSDWHRDVIQPVNQVPHIVAHELIHFQQTYEVRTLLEICIKEGSADFLAELISGKHINQHIHDYANLHEAELWFEFSTMMDDTELNGWLYTSSPGRPNDLGYWMGYKITKAYYDLAEDKRQAISDILNIKDFHKFLDDSGYANRFAIPSYNPIAMTN